MRHTMRRAVCALSRRTVGMNNGRCGCRLVSCRNSFLYTLLLPLAITHVKTRGLHVAL